MVAGRVRLGLMVLLIGLWLSPAAWAERVALVLSLIHISQGIVR